MKTRSLSVFQDGSALYGNLILRGIRTKSKLQFMNSRAIWDHSVEEKGDLSM